MKRFTAALNDGDYINIEANRMEIVENAILVYQDTELVAYVDVSIVLRAHISERGVLREQ